MITPNVHAILLFASTLLPEHLCIKKFLSAAFHISQHHEITTLFLELWNSFWTQCHVIDRENRGYIPYIKPGPSSWIALRLVWCQWIGYWRPPGCSPLGCQAVCTPERGSRLSTFSPAESTTNGDVVTPPLSISSYFGWHIFAACDVDVDVSRL